MGAGPRQVLDASPVAPPRVGLVASARAVTEPDERWINGFTWAPENCSEGVIVDPCDANPSKNISANPDVSTFDPYVIVAGDKCSPFQERDYKSRAQRKLLACESKAIEKEFWTGTQAQSSGWTGNRYLASNAADDLSGGSAVTPLEALACLEQYLGDCVCGGVGMIHATRSTVLIWSQYNVLIREGNIITTINGTIVVPGAGYDGSGPDGDAATDGNVWAYATGLVEVRRSAIAVFPDTMAEALNRMTNLVEFRVERMAAATWDGCCLGAVLANVPVCSEERPPQ